jgi:molybdopterin-guanine dinucleotide biosynthesis protein A
MGRDKATLPYLGGTLLEYVLKVVKQRCAPVFVIAAPGQQMPSVDEAEVLRDDVRGVGPLVATGRGLRAAAEAGLRWAFVCAVDMPFLDPVLIDVLVEASENLTADVVLPWDGRDHFLAGLYRTSLVDRINELVAAGERSMVALANSVETQRIVVSDGRWFTNMNTAADLSLLR